MPNYIKFLFFLFSLSYLSCINNNQNKIDIKILKIIFIDTNKVYKTLNINDFKSNEFSCKFINDTIKRNSKNGFKDALKKLIEKYNCIDELKTNDQTKQYIKSLLLEEWLYSSFNFQFLGPVLGLADTSRFNIDFGTSDISNCYLIGNTNQVAVWCGERTKLFIRLADSLLHLKTKKITFKNTHTFPLVEIGNAIYIIDPFDPFILFDENLQTVVDYNKLIANTENINIKALRTKRNFGNSGELISKNFYNLLKNKYANKSDDVGIMISRYLNQNRRMLTGFIDSCTFESFSMKTKVFPVVSLTNSFVLFTTQNTLPNCIKNSRFNKLYLGFDCRVN